MRYFIVLVIDADGLKDAEKTAEGIADSAHASIISVEPVRQNYAYGKDSK